MVSRDSEYRKRIEAALFASGRPLTIRQLKSAAGARKVEKVEKALRELVEEYGARDTSLEIVEIGRGNYMLRVKPEYSGFVRRIGVKPMMSRAILKTLTLIGLKQPIAQSRIVSLRGSHAYKQIKRLVEMGLLEASREGRSKMLRLTPTGLSIFGARSDDELKQALRARLQTEQDYEQNRNNSKQIE
ncbi:MAG: SMC-Scp complex subunit ScpB [Candidatus Brockarchaeota archaeon]|nr:SMC-Scp complex subunit ScpB [Candidatus Brockarchaeota archaeon]